LSELYGSARDNDPTFQSARYALEAAKQKRPEAFSALLPSLIANASTDRTLGRTRYTGTPQISRGFNGDQWMLQLTQPLFRVQSLLVYDEARASVEQALAQFAAAQQDLILRFSRAYFDAIVAERHIATARAQVQALDEQLSAAQRSFEAGVASISDVDDTKSHAALAQAQLVAAMNDLQNASAALEAILGAPPPALNVLNDEANLPQPVPADVLTWVQRASEDHPNVKAAQAVVKGADYELDRTRSQRLPSVDLVASYGGNYSAGNITQPTDFGTNVHDKQVSVQVSMPILDGGALHAQTAEARAKHAKAQADLAAAERQAALDARQAYYGVLSGVSQVQALQTAVAAGRSAVKGNRIGYGLGIRINSDVLNAEQQLYSTMQDLEKARYDTLFEGLKLKAAAGELSEQDLTSIDTLLNTPVRSDTDSASGSMSPAP
jgi:outer membrane protein